MSQLRCETADGNEVLFGLDHMCGWFYQEFEDGYDEPVVDRDSFNGTLSKSELVELLNPTSCPQQYITMIALDLDPGKVTT